MKYKFKIHTDDMGTYWGICSDTLMETAEENALWDVNKAREHDGLKPLDEMPRGTVYERLD